MEKVKLGIVGFGFMGHCDADMMETFDEIDLVAVADTNPEQLTDAPEGVETYASLDEMLANADINVVMVSTPNPSHPEMVKKAAAAGKHVICEKPAAMSVAEYDEMVAACKENGVLFTVHQQRRWDKDYRVMKEVYDQALVGDMYLIKSQLYGVNGNMHDWHVYPEMGGGMLYDWGVHLIDQMPSCYDAFLENKIYDNRTLSLGEQINMMKRDIRLASLLGFKNLRTLVSTPMDVIEGSLEYAAEMDVKIGLEVHASFSLNSGWADGYLEMIHRTGTKYFGFIPDMGIFCKNIPDVLREKARRQGASEECIKIVDDAYVSRLAKGFVKIKYDLNLGKANMEYRMANGMKEMMEAVERAGAGPADKAYAGASFTYSWSEPQDIIDNIDYIFHTHAKFYHVHEDGTETAVAIPEVVEAFKKAGYKGYLSSEYEGGEHLRDIGVDSIEQVRRHQEALRKAIEE